MNPSTSQPPVASSNSSSASVIVTSYSHPNSITNSEKINSNSRNESKISSKDTDSEEEKSQKDSFADDDSSQRNSIDIASLLSTERSTNLQDSDYCRATSDYSILSDTSTYDEIRQTGASEVELNLTDISVPPSETSESATLESENDYGDAASSNSERDSYKDLNEEGYDVYSDGLYNIPEEGNSLLECGYDSNNENIRYYSTIIEETEEEDSPVPSSSEAYGRKLNMGQYYSSSSGGAGENNAKKTKRKSNETYNGSHNSSHVSSDGWRMSQASTNTNVSTSTGADSDDTLAENMSELSSVNSHLSNLGRETGQDFKSLDGKEIKYALRASKTKKDDPDATPVASPLPIKKDSTIIKNAINELENIEQAAQNLLQQRQTSPKLFGAFPDKKVVSDEKDLSELANINDSTLEQTNCLNENDKDVIICNGNNTETNINNNNIIILPSYEKKEERTDIKPPLAPIASPPTSDNKRKQWSKCKELKPYISRESYNEEAVLKEIEALRESYNEADLNDFLDKLESSGVKDSMDDSCFEQLLADIKADVRWSKLSSTESLQSIHSVTDKKSNIRASQESLNSLSKFKATTSRKLEVIKDRILDLFNVKKKHKCSKSLKPNVLNRSENESKSVNSRSRSITPSPQPQTPQLTDFKPLNPDWQDTKSSRPETPDIKGKKSPKQEAHKGEEKKGFKISNFLRKGSPKILRKKHSKEAKNRKSDIATSESEGEDTEIVNKEVSEKPNGSVSSIKGSGKSSPTESQELKKEVRFNLKEELVTSNKENLLDNQTVPTSTEKVTEATKKENEKEEKIKKNKIIPVTVEEMNKKIEYNEDPNRRAENILLKLPERIKPPRRKKKHLIPTTVEDINVESAFQRSSDESGSSSKNSVSEPEYKNAQIIMAEPIQCTKYLDDDQKQRMGQVNNAHESTLLSDTKDKPYYDDRNLERTCIYKKELDMNKKCNEYKNDYIVPEIHLDEINDVSEMKDAAAESDLDLKSNEFQRESTPSFPNVDENMASFYDNVNPYFELMSKLQEEEEPEPDMIEKPIIAGSENLEDSSPHLRDEKEHDSQELKIEDIIESYTNDDKRSSKSFEDSIKEIKYNLQLDDDYNLIENRSEEPQNNMLGSYRVGSTSHQEACHKSLEKERKPYNIDELNSITEEIARITDDMEKDMDIERIRSGFSPIDERLNPKSPTRYTPNAILNANVMQASPVPYISSISTQTERNKANKIKNQEAAYQTDTDHDETDIETESKLESMPSKHPVQTKHFFGPTKPYSRREMHSSIQPFTSPAQKKAPSIPPRHFQLKMPQTVVDELKSVLSDNEEPRTKIPALPPRCDTALTFNNGRCNSGMSDFVEPNESSNPSYAAKMQSDCWQASVSVADPHVSQPLSSSVPSNNITSCNLITTSYIKNTKPNRNEKLDRRRSSSLSTENLAPIPEEASLTEINFKVINEKTFRSEISKVKEEKMSEQQKGRIIRVRANVYPSFDLSNLHGPRGKPPVPRPPYRRVHSSMDGYQSDPGIPKFQRSRSVMECEEGYVTDSELLASKHYLYPDKHKFTRKNIHSYESLDYTNKTVYDDISDTNFPPPRPPPPSKETLFSKNLKDTAHTGQASSHLKEDCKIINKRLEENYFPLYEKPNEKELIKARPHSTDFSQTKNSFNLHQNTVHPLTKQTSLENSLQSITLSACKLHEEHPKEEQNKNDANFGTKPRNEVSYLANRARPLTWCNESDFKSSYVSNVNDKMINSTNAIESIDLKCYEGEDNAYSESRPSSQLSQCSNQRLQAQGLGEWLFLARLDRTNQLLSQLNSTMQLQPDRSPGSSSEQYNGNTDYIMEKRYPPPPKTPPLPPPRPRPPIDERDPEQVLAERRYLSYFQTGPPRAKHKPDDEAPKSPSFQQLTAQTRYNNYFIGPPHSNPEKVNIKTPDLENDENVLAAQRRYNTYFHGPPKPPPRNNPIKEIVEDEETLEAQKRYLSYFKSNIPRQRSSVSQEKTPEPDEEQKAAEQRYLSYFRSGPPRPRSNREVSKTPEPDEEQKAAEQRYLSHFSSGPPRPPRPRSGSEVSKTPEPDEEQIAAEKRYLSYFRSGPPRPSKREVSKTPEPDEEQIAAEQRYLSYFRSGPPRPRSASEVSKTPEPDEEQIAAEKRFLKYFEGLPKAKHERKENTTPEITAEMVAAEERFLKYFEPIPYGAPRKRVDPPPPTEEESKKLQLFAEYQKALEGRVTRKQMKIVRVSKPKHEHEREKTPPTLREIVVDEFLQRVKDRKKEKDLHFGDTDDEDEDDIMKEIPKTLPSEEPIIQGGGTFDPRISQDLKLFVSEEGEFEWIQE